jgi:glutaconate CoA-transferase subunit A
MFTKEKVITAAEAALFIKDGMHLGVGAGMDMNPMPVVREVIKRGVKGLTLTPVVTGGYVADLLIGAGCVETVQFPQVVMDEFGLAPNFRKKSEKGELKFLETM